MGGEFTEHIERTLWAPRGADEFAPLYWLRVLGRYAYAVIRDLGDGQLTLRAMSLVYTTLLSIVPLLAFSFSVLKGFGVHQKIEPQLYAFLAPLGDKGAELTDRIIGFVDNVKGSVLGGIGLVLLIYTAVSMIQKVENAFNFVWQVQASRGLARRFSDYLSIILLGPVLMVTATGLLASASSSSVVQRLSEIQPFGAGLVLIGKVLPFFLVVGVFTFVYAFIPNTRVQVKAALGGALVGGLAWFAAGDLFASFVAGSTRYSAIYSSFAIAIIALIWLYLSWLILLIGAQISFYVQHPRLMQSGRKRLLLSAAQVEQVALRAMYRIARGHKSGNPPDLEAVNDGLEIPARVLDTIVSKLEEASLVMRAEGGELLPARDTAQISVGEVLAAVRGERPEAADGPVESVLRGMAEAANESYGKVTLEELVNQGEEPAPA
ncbi:MAG: YhjD/YihY/BrkB family envelope integrity protein [Anaerolineae bacterium]